MKKRIIYLSPCDLHEELIKIVAKRYLKRYDTQSINPTLTDIFENGPFDKKLPLLSTEATRIVSSYWKEALNKSFSSKDALNNRYNELLTSLDYIEDVDGLLSYFEYCLSDIVAIVVRHYDISKNNNKQQYTEDVGDTEDVNISYPCNNDIPACIKTMDDKTGWVLNKDSSKIISLNTVKATTNIRSNQELNNVCFNTKKYNENEQKELDRIIKVGKNINTFRFEYAYHWRIYEILRFLEITINSKNHTPIADSIFENNKLLMRSGEHYKLLQKTASVLLTKYYSLVKVNKDVLFTKVNNLLIWLSNSINEFNSENTSYSANDIAETFCNKLSDICLSIKQ